MDPLPPEGGRREATHEEAKALANPLRLRILRLCLDESLTNKEVAGRLGRDPGSTLHHVRLLVDTGFLEPTEVRAGAKGALEKPYRSTGKSWRVTVVDPAMADEGGLAMVDAFREELAEAGHHRVEFMTRFANRLNAESIAELDARLEALVNEFALRDDAGGKRYAFFLAGHLRSEEVSERGGKAARDR
jgi:DNA-binding transcriptional ArsR family regulator